MPRISRILHARCTEHCLDRIAKLAPFLYVSFPLLALAACKSPTGSKLYVPTDIIVAAHRGFPGLFPENTLVAVRGALDRGADAVEVDVRLTRDGIPVLMHDPTVDRTTNGVGAVNSLTFEQVKRLDACSKFDPALGPCIVPTLKDALQAVRGRGMLIIELKGPFSTSALASLLAEISREGMQHHVIVASFDFSQLATLRNLSRTIVLARYDQGPGARLALSRLKPTAEMPEKSILLDAPFDARAYITSLFADSMDVIPWTVVNAQEAKALAGLGIRHFLSDVPLAKDELRAALTRAMKLRGIAH